MRFSSLIFFSGLAAAATSDVLIGSLSPDEVLKKLESRAIEYCKPISRPYTCERSCGTGFVECGSFPNCYNPGRGDTCCRNGKYCPTGYYCTDAGCCPNGKTLAQCGATETLTGSPPKATSSLPGNDDLSSIRSKVSSLASSIASGISSRATSSSSRSFSLSLDLSSPTRTAGFPSATAEPTEPSQPGNPFNQPIQSAPSQTQQPNAAGRVEGSLMAGALGMLAMLL